MLKLIRANSKRRDAFGVIQSFCHLKGLYSILLSDNPNREMNSNAFFIKKNYKMDSNRFLNMSMYILMRFLQGKKFHLSPNNKNKAEYIHIRRPSFSNKSE